MTHLDVEYETDSAGAETAAVVKFSDDRWEVNVRARASEFSTLRDIRTFAWDTRNVAKVGSCAGASVFWCSDGQTATIMVGQDDETWDVSVSVPVEVIDDLVRRMELHSLS